VTIKTDADSKASTEKNSVWQKIISVFLGLLLTAFILEAGLRLGGWAILATQEFSNPRSIKQKGEFRILCLGDSTTQNQYPQLLEQVLNQRNVGMHFSVVDKGKIGTNTPAILSHVEAYLSEYHPDLVVAMMGINDHKVKYYQDIPESEGWLFRHSRLYRFCRILYVSILKKIKREDIYGLNKLGQIRRAKLEDIGTVTESINLPEKSLRKAIELNPKNDTAYVELGQLYRKQGRFAEAENSFKKAIEFNPNNDIAHLKLAELYQVQDKFSQAEDSFKKALELKPENEDIHIQLGDLYRYQDKFLQAEGSLKKALEINPKNDSVHVRLGEVYRKQGEFLQAENFFEKAIGISPKKDEIYVKLGLLYWGQGKFPQAEIFFKKAIEISPKKDNGYVKLGTLYWDQGKLAQAEDLFKKAVKINPENDNTYVELGRLYRSQNKFPQAEDLFEKAVALTLKSNHIFEAMSSLYEGTGRPELAREYAKKIKRLKLEYCNPVTVNNYRRLKELLDKRGIKLVCAQYPVRSVEPLKRIFEKDEGVIFVDNERAFKEVLGKENYKEYFRDMFGGDFGHCTRKGNELLAQNIADVILREAFNKQ
jgi:Tfp pilus assembly protein PilF